MHLPRARATVGTLLCFVALVAVNIRVFRPYYERETSIGSSLWSYRIPRYELGLIPLLNVAAIGSWLFLTNRLRAYRCVRKGEGRWPRSDVAHVIAYLSVNLLVTLLLARHFVPDADDRCQEAYESVLAVVANRWYAVLGSPNGSVPWMTAGCALAGVMVSGLPLALVWIGRTLARRAATTLPLARFRLMVVLVTIGFAGADLAIALTLRRFEDEQKIALQFRVVDAETSLPMRAAFVCLLDPFSYDDSIPPRALTDGDGWGSFDAQFVVRGETNAFMTLAEFDPWGRWLVVSAPGYQTRHVPLAELLGSVAEAADAGLGEVALARGDAVDKSFGDVAGTYAMGGNGFGGWTLQIEADGRFAWEESGCMPPPLREYGHVERRGDELALVPIAHAGNEGSPDMQCRYRIVDWGPRRYVAPVEELEDFCRQVLTPSRPSRSSRCYGFLSSCAERDSPRTGLPQLPANVWARFLRSEISLQNKDGTLRLALDSLARSGRSRVGFLARAGHHK